MNDRDQAERYITSLEKRIDRLRHALRSIATIRNGYERGSSLNWTDECEDYARNALEEDDKESLQAMP
jgi:hypothetical protein